MLKQILALVSLGTLVATSDVSADVDPFKWFMADQTYHTRVDLLSLKRSVDDAAIASSLESSGHDVELESATSVRGFQLVTEMRMKDYLGVELGLVQVEAGNSRMSLTSDDPEAAAEELVEVLPVTASGVTVGVASSATVTDLFGLDVPFMHRLRLRGRAGLHVWQGTVAFSAGGETASRERSGTDLYFGGGVGVEFGRSLEAMLEYQYFGADWDQAGVSLGLRYQFW